MSSTAITIAAQTAITVQIVPTIERVYVKPARNRLEIVSRIRESSACLSDIASFLRTYDPNRDLIDLKTVNYAMARARYRENMSLSVEHVAILTEMSVKKVRKYYDRLCIQIGERITNNQASALMTAVADYS